MEFPTSLFSSSAAPGTATAGAAPDWYRPSFFEIVAVDQLSDLLRPAFVQVLTSYAQRWPRYLLRVANAHEEVYALLMGLIEHHYLSAYSGSFTENFYGLKREPHGGEPLTLAQLAQTSTEARLSKRLVSRSLLTIVLVPYVGNKLEAHYERLSQRPAFASLARHDPTSLSVSPQRSPWLMRIRARVLVLFLLCYPYAKALFLGASLACQILYMFGKTEYYSPLLKLVGLRIRRMSQADHARGTSQTSGPWTLKSLPSRGLDLLKLALPAAVFVFRFQEWWRSSHFVRNQSKQVPTPPPPSQIRPLSGVDLPPPHICYLCGKPRTNPAMIPSGYVFCYPCIFRHLEEQESCPITGFPTETLHLRKVYDIQG